MQTRTYSTDELKQYVTSYLTNRYIEFFKNLILDYEPNEIIPSDAFKDLVKYRYSMSTLDLLTIKNAIKDGTVSDDDRALFYKLENIKDFITSFNKNIQDSISLIEDYHSSIGSDYKCTLFHIYAYFVFDISTATDNYNFANLLSYTVSKNNTIREQTIYNVPYRFGRKTSRYTSNKIKKRWVEKSFLNGIDLEKRKPTHHYMTNSMRKHYDKSSSDQNNSQMKGK